MTADLECQPMRSLSPLAAALACTLAADAMAAVTVSPEDGCPSGEAITTNLDRLGALSALNQLGGAQVTVQGSALHVSFRDYFGEPLGARTVMASEDCAERATLAAAVIATCAGDWARTKLAEPAPVPVATPESRAARPWQAELGALAFGVHDGDEGTFGLGGRADVGLGPWMATAIGEASWSRERSVGTGQGSYRFIRAGLGPGIRSQGDRLFWDAALLAMVERLALEGKNLTPPNTASDWDMVVAISSRLGWNGRRVRPFVFLEASYSTPQQNMLPTGRADRRVSLSQFNVEAGLGISFAFLP
jgi:hypothetical protein